MSQPSLILLDGAAQPYVGAETALKTGGWDVLSVPSVEVSRLVVNQAPNLVLIDPQRSGAAGVAAVAALRNRFPNLPVVTLGAGNVPGAVASLDPSTPPQHWVERLNGLLGTLRAEGNKFTAEDLFADILADLEVAPAVGDPPTPPVAAEPPAPTPEPPKEAPRTAVAPDALRTVPLKSLPPKAPAPKVVVPPPAPKAGSPTPKVKVPVPHIEFTLSGISGIKDPFVTEEPEALAPPVPEPEPEPLPTTPPNPTPNPSEGRAADVELEFLGTSDATPVARRPAAPPLPQVPSTPIQEPLPNSLEEFGNYYLLEKIAVGGMAELFKARQRGVHNFEKIVAIKRILPHLSDNDEFVRMFIDEAKLAAQLTHPNIVQIFDLGKAGGFYYIAMEFVDGKDLRSLLRKVREYHMPFPEPVAAFVAMKVAGALDYAHRKKGMNDKELKLVHRDISPQNILISTEGAVKLVDFGIAKAATKSTQTMAGALKGKLLYMSPEQALGHPLDSRSDIYSLGLVLFELLTGERCFQADSELGVLEKVRLGKVQDVRSVNPSVSAAMASILERALQKDVERRYPSARFLERDLKAYLGRLPNEPTEHEVAEYVNTLLRGTKEQLQDLVASHWPVVAVPPSSGSEPAQPSPSPLPKVVEDAPTAAAKVLPLPPPPPPSPTLEAPEPKRWVMPVVAVIVVVGLVLLGHFLTR